jgi:hypothetical protein
MMLGGVLLKLAIGPVWVTGVTEQWSQSGTNEKWNGRGESKAQ